MPHRYDATLKTLIEQYPLDWLRSLGVPVEGPVSLMEADLSTVSADADKLLYIEQPEPTLVNVELQTSRDPELAQRLLLYAALVFYRHKMRLLGLAVLLRREADHPELTGTIGYESTLGGRLEYEYRVVRVWEQTPDWALDGGLGTVPLAPLTQITQADLPGVIRRMETRMGSEPPAVRDTLWTTTYILMGLRYPESISRQVLKEVRSMRDSATYQAILREGREEGREEGEQIGRTREARALLQRLGERRFGSPNLTVTQTLQTLSIERLEELVLRVLDVESWDELLAG